MRVNGPIDQKYNYALSQVFSPALLQKLDDPVHEDNIKSLLHNCKLYPENQQWSFVNGLDVAYNYLKNNYRCEYVYKNEIANQLLLKYHSDNSATLLKEVASDTSIADIVIINGSTVAYEIKTELDSFERLPGQIESYKILYDYLYIVTHPDAVKPLRTKIDKSVGLIVLSTDGTLKTIRKAGSNIRFFSPAKAVFTLRQGELVSAYKKYVGELPPMGTALISKFCHNWFLSLDKVDALIVFRESLKSRKPSNQQFQLISNCNHSLKMLFLGRDLTKKYCSSAMDRLGIFV